jgi:hypothetical protein
MLTANGRQWTLMGIGRKKAQKGVLDNGTALKKDKGLKR